MDQQTILIHVENRIATVTINRPEAGNALARETYGEIAAAMEQLGGGLPDFRKQGGIGEQPLGQQQPAGL